jgi:HEPN domain-containing protein
MPGINDWLRKASSDLKLAKKALGDDETIDPAVYLAHQCAEKSLKAFFVLIGKTIPKTHDLGALLNGCTNLDLEFILLQKECTTLDPYGFNSRYPNDALRVNQTDLIEAIGMANKIFYFVSNKVLS